MEAILFIHNIKQNLHFLSIQLSSDHGLTRKGKEMTKMFPVTGYL